MEKHVALTYWYGIILWVTLFI